MTKQEAIINLSSIFNRGNSSDADASAFFLNKKHDDLLDLMIARIANSHKLIGNPKIFKTQALNDRGVDIIVEFANIAKIGIQIKSPFDVTEKQFALKVKAQMAESQAHAIDKWFLFICSPLTVGKEDYSGKIGHLLNELSSYKSPYHSVYTPQQCYNILNSGIQTDADFKLIKNQFFYEPVDWKLLLGKIKEDKEVEGYLNRIKPENDVNPENFDLYLKYSEVSDDEEKKVVIENVTILQNALKKLSKKTREFLYVAVERAAWGGFVNKTFVANCRDLENYLGISEHTLKNEVAVLSDNKIAEFDNENDEKTWYVSIRPLNYDYNIFDHVKKFCYKYDRPLKEIIVDLNFSHFDS